MSILGRLKPKLEIDKLQKEKNHLMADRDWAYGGCAVREEEIKWLKIEKEKLIKENSRLLLDNERVYQGHAGLMEEINFLKFRIDELDRLHDEVVIKNWTNNTRLKSYICSYPFERIEILPRGEVYTCCSAYLKHNHFIGNIFEQSFDEIWNSEKAKKLRYSVSKGNFEYCNHFCKWLHLENNSENAQTGNYNPINLRDDEKFKLYRKYEDYKLDNYPKYITFSCDETCNLTCPSCRNKIKGLNMHESERLTANLIKTIRPIMSDCELLGALGSGDIFASKAMMDFYQTLSNEEFPKLKLYIITNAQLLDKKMWEKLSNLHNIPTRMAISVDAASKEVYEKIRRGGRWEILCKNLEFISTKRYSSDAKIEFLIFNFLIQKDNYMEIRKFIEFAKSMGADAVEFQMMSNWGTYDMNIFKEINVLNPNNAYYSETIQALRDVINNPEGLTIVQNIL